MAKAFAKICYELRSRYTVSYKPADFTPDGRFRRINIAARKTGEKLEVHARKGYRARLASSLTGKEIRISRIEATTVWAAALRSVISWIAYGIAFQFFVRGILGSAAGGVLSYIAVYAASYIIGFLALFAPGGAVVRESALVTGMVRLGLSSRPDALAVAIASRLWLTVLELVPGLFFLAVRKPVSRPSQ